MRRLVLVFILLLAIAGLLGWAISQSAGYVLITYDRFRYESSFWVFLALIGCLWLLALAVHWVLGLLHVSGALINPWSRRHRERRVEKASRRGLRELAEGQWRPALGHLQLAAERDRQPLVHYLERRGQPTSWASTHRATSCCRRLASANPKPHWRSA